MLPDKDGPGVGGGQISPEGEDPSVSLFREYLRLKTVHPDPDYGEISSLQDTDIKPCPLEMSQLDFCFVYLTQFIVDQSQNSGWNMPKMCPSPVHSIF